MPDRRRSAIAIGGNRNRRAPGPGSLRVAQVCGLTRGGEWFLDICAHLRARGYDVYAVIGAPEGELAANLRAREIPYVMMPQTLRSPSRLLAQLEPIPILGRARLVGDSMGVIRTALKMSRILRDRETDVVHTHIFVSTLIGRMAAFAARVPIRIAMIPGPYHLQSTPSRLLDLGTQWMDHCLIAGSKFVDDLYARFGVSAERRACTYYGADPGRFDPAHAEPNKLRGQLGIGSDVPLVGQVARFYPVKAHRLTPPEVRGRGLKGHEDFVDAAQLVLEQQPGVRFLLVGDGWGPGGEAHLADIKQRCRDYGIDHAVMFTGHRSDIPDVLAALDISVQCSLNENLGGTIESLLMEVPTVATRVGGMPESIRHEQTGLLVPPRNPKELAAAMLRLLDDRDLAVRLARAGRQLMLDQFTIDRTVQDIDRVYRRVARRRGLAKPPLT